MEGVGWQHRKSGHGTRHVADLAGRGLVYVSAGSQRGWRSPIGSFRPVRTGSFVIKAGPAHEVLRTNSVGEPVHASLALAGGTIYIRGTQHLFAIRQARR